MTSISVIIPTHNEEKEIESCLRAIIDVAKKDGVEVQVVVVDSSKDTTAKLAKKYTTEVYKAKKPGRGQQLQQGFKQAKHNYILLLHADTRIQPGAYNELVNILKDEKNSAGCYRADMRKETIRYKLGELFQRLRVQWFGIMYGDQGMYMKKELLEEIGGIPQQELMEDVELSKKLRRKGKIIQGKTPIYVSTRRFKQEGSLRYLWTHTTTLLLYHLGVPLEKVATYYKKRAK